MPYDAPTTDIEIRALAKQNWDADRARLRIEIPAWVMTSWSRARAWQRRPYLRAAKSGKHPDAE